MIFLFFFYCYADHRNLHSFPTRRSSDLKKRDEIEAGKSYCSRRFGGATCDDKSAQIYARFDKNDWRIQPFLSKRRSEERFSRNAETDLVCRLLLEKKK